VAIDVSIDTDACMGSGNCVFAAPGAFELDDDGIAIVADVDAASDDAVIAAAQNCPAHAITVHRNGEQIV
jgi:ferredoxin